MRGTNRLGWPTDDAGGGGTNLLTDTPVGVMGMSGDTVLPVAPTWSATMFDTPGLFNNTAVIESIGSGQVRCKKAGTYFINAYLTTANTTTTCDSNVRVIKNGTTLVPDSEQQIFENNTDADRDMLSKGVAVVLEANDTIEVQVNSSDANNTLQGFSTWTIFQGTGVQGNVGQTGASSIDPQEFSVYRNEDETGRNVTAGVNVFINSGGALKVSELYDPNDVFDIVTNADWTPPAGKYIVSANVSFGSVGDTNWAHCYLYNVTQARIENIGSQGRNEGNGEFNSTLSCQISANGTDVYELRVDSNDSSVTLQGATSADTYFMASRFTETA